ncbi:MAG: NUDIX domain-containing protein [Patescibacteria group bacterium]
MKKPIIIASGPVIIENDKVLLNKHGDDGFWKFVGGRVEDYSVSLEETAEREVMEEMGIGANLIKPLKPMLIELPNKIVVLIHYLAERRGKIKPGEDILAWDWFDINNLPLDSAPNIKPVIKEYLESKNVDK